jgi:glycosyltransferase involved in cell wall biosynthesis
VKVLVAAEQLRRPSPGGIGTYARGLLGGLAQLGGLGGLAQLGESQLEVTVWASRIRPPGQQADPLAGLVSGWPVRIHPAPSRLLTRLWDLGLGRPPAGFDVVHSVSLASPPQGRAPASVMVHDVAWRTVPEAFPARGRAWHEAALGRAVRRASLLVCPSPGVADALTAAGARRVEVIEEGCDHLPAPDERGADELLARLRVPGPYLLSVGTLEPRKNLSRLVAAYGRARSRLPEPWPLVVVGFPGWGPSRPELRAPGVIVAGSPSDAVLSALYARARCMAYVPLLEGWGLPAVEAMAAGIPVVASPMPSTGGAAYEVDPRDVASIATGLLAAACDLATRVELVERGSRRAAALRWDIAAQRHLDAWEQLC